MVSIRKLGSFGFVRAKQQTVGIERIVEFVHRRTRLLLVVFSLACVAGMILFAARRPMWVDEYLTFYLAQLPAAELWKALLTGAESHPPPFLLLTHASMTAFGSGVVALRLPAIAGFLLMELCVFRFVSRRTSRLVAFAAMLIPFTTRAANYAIEARGYGLLLGMTGLALVCWQAAGEERGKGVATAGLAVSLAAATSFHYFGALIAVPLALGEVVRTVMEKRVNYRIWLAFAAPAVPLAVCAPFLRAGRAYAAHHGLLHAEFDYFAFVLRDGHALLLVILMAIAAYGVLRNAGAIEIAEPAQRGFRPHEVAVVFGLFLLPVVTYFLTKGLHLPFANRYVLSAAIAVSLLVAIALAALRGRDAIAALTIAGLVIWAGGRYWSRGTGAAGAEPEDHFVLSHSRPGAPIAIADIDSFLRLKNSGLASLASRVVYLTDAELAFRFLGNDTADRILTDLRPWLPLHVEPFCAYISRTPEFYIYGSPDVNTNWLERAVGGDSMRTEVVAVNGGRPLLLVHPKYPSGLCDAEGQQARPAVQ